MSLALVVFARRFPMLRALYRPFALATFALVALLCAGPAEAQATRVVVQSFSGPGGSGLRRRLISDLEENGVEVVSEAEIRRARRELGFGRRIEDDQYVALARELRAAAFIDGRVRRARRRYRLQVRVRNGFDAEVLGGATWEGRRPSSLAAVGRNGYARLRTEIGNARVPPPAQPAANPTPGTTRVAISASSASTSTDKVRADTTRSDAAS